jgi:hypothetical protein
MTTDTYINENKTSTLKKGDTVVMHSCGEANFYKGKIWKCQTDSYLDRGKRLFLLKDLAVAFLLNIFNEYIRHSIIVNGNGYHKAAYVQNTFRLLDDNRCYILVAFLTLLN